MSNTPAIDTYRSNTIKIDTYKGKSFVLNLKSNVNERTFSLSFNTAYTSYLGNFCEKDLMPNGISTIDIFHHFLKIIFNGKNEYDETLNTFSYCENSELKNNCSKPFVELLFIYKNIITKTITFKLFLNENDTLTEENNLLFNLINNLTKRLDEQEKKNEELIESTKQTSMVHTGLNNGNGPIMINKYLDELTVKIYDGCSHMIYSSTIFINYTDFSSLYRDSFRDVNCDKIWVSFDTNNEFFCDFDLLPNNVTYLNIKGTYSIDNLRGLENLKKLKCIHFEVRNKCEFDAVMKKYLEVNALLKDCGRKIELSIACVFNESEKDIHDLKEKYKDIEFNYCA